MTTYGAKTVIYVRQSLDRDGNELAISRQRADCERLVTYREWDLVEIVPDNDLSASGKVTRPGFDKVIEMIEQGKATAVVAWDFTRLSRNFRDTLRLLEVGQRAGATLSFVQGSEMNLGTADGRTIAGILSSVAQGEIDKKSERQKGAARQAAAAGKPYGGRRPFGYEKDRETIRETEAAGLRAAYDSLLAGVPLARCAKDLNDAGLFTTQTTRDGQTSRWTAQTLGPVLKSPRYAGLRAITIRPEHGRPTWQIIGDATWQAIVPEDVWRAAVSLLEAPERGRRGALPKGLLTGVALCQCGATVHRGGAATTQPYPIYRCSASTGHLSRRAEPVENYVRDVVLARLQREDAAELLADTERPDVDELRKEATALRTQIDGLARLYAERVLDEAGVRRESERLRARLGEVEQLQADAGRVDVLGPLIGAEDARAVWDELGVDRQRAVIDVLMTVRLLPPGRGTRTFRPDTVEIAWR